MPAAALPPTRPSGHPSALALHEYQLSLLAPAEAERVGQHLASCELCRGDLSNLVTDQKRFEREVFPQTREAVVRGAAPRRRWRLALPSVGLAVAAAAAWLLVARPVDRDDDILRPKGASTLAIFAARQQGVLPVEDGKTVLRPGDRIRFVLWPSGLRHVLIASVDGTGKATVYHPFGGQKSAPLPEGMRVEVPGSIQLDDRPGPERVFAVLAPDPFAAGVVVRALERLARQGTAAVRATSTLPFPLKSVTQQSILFEKTP